MRTCSFCQNCGRSDLPANKWNANLPNWQSLWSLNWSSFQSRVNLARKSSQSGRTGWSGRTILTRPKLLAIKKTSGLQWNGVTVQNQYVLFRYFHCARPLTIHSDLHAILLFFLFSLLWINAATDLGLPIINWVCFPGLFVTKSNLHVEYPCFADKFSSCYLLENIFPS